jgi:hypothetical protein
LEDLMDTAVVDGKTAVEHAHDADQAIRAINHLTFNTGALPYPSDAWLLLGHLSTLAARLPQAFDQIATQVRAWHRDGLIGIDPGTRFANEPLLAVATAAIALTDHATTAANQLTQALNTAHDALAYAHYTGPCDQCDCSNHDDNGDAEDEVNEDECDGSDCGCCERGQDNEQEHTS